MLSSPTTSSPFSKLAQSLALSKDTGSIFPRVLDIEVFPMSAGTGDGVEAIKEKIRELAAAADQRDTEDPFVRKFGERRRKDKDLIKRK